MTISETLRQAVRSSGSPQRTVAREAGISECQLSRFLHGAGLSAESLDRLARHFNLGLVSVKADAATPRSSR